ncbi:DUF4112 domain-containing protein [Sphingobacterium phlebotomi]|uniref:DUF4112 domain-containing protein n=1 Tax=Sphingobacterium phlebotomi TaxID=2605433 RepID=A0A5D4H932_9SPHI|nr:DUF4112 domain-containing protein [Sphingobacterium phlebotomi]TYR37366.1 DUF4112 domain-containing protein [Sphingobacterium phlebotomi]
MNNKLSFDKDKRIRELRWVERVSTLLDNKFNIGGFRFGLDPLLNFFPILGQTITFATSVLLVLVMFRNGVSSKAATKMLLNTIFDAVIGSIPILGNILDFFYKANQRNIKILREHYNEGKHQGSAKGILTVLFLMLLALCILLFYLLWVFGEWIIGIIAH